VEEEGGEEEEERECTRDTWVKDEDKEKKKVIKVGDSRTDRATEKGENKKKKKTGTEQTASHQAGSN